MSPSQAFRSRALARPGCKLQRDRSADARGPAGDGGDLPINSSGHMHSPSESSFAEGRPFRVVELPFERFQIGDDGFRLKRVEFELRHVGMRRHYALYKSFAQQLDVISQM